MVGKTHPYLQTAYAAALVFFSSLCIIILMALYVHSVSASNAALPEEEIARNLTPPGQVYPRP